MTEPQPSLAAALVRRASIGAGLVVFATVAASRATAFGRRFLFGFPGGVAAGSCLALLLTAARRLAKSRDDRGGSTVYMNLLILNKNEIIRKAVDDAARPRAIQRERRGLAGRVVAAAGHLAARAVSDEAFGAGVAKGVERRLPALLARRGITATAKFEFRRGPLVVVSVRFLELDVAALLRGVNPVLALFARLLYKGGRRACCFCLRALGIAEPAATVDAAVSRSVAENFRTRFWKEVVAHLEGDGLEVDVELARPADDCVQINDSTQVSTGRSGINARSTRRTMHLDGNMNLTQADEARFLFDAIQALDAAAAAARGSAEKKETRRKSFAAVRNHLSPPPSPGGRPRDESLDATVEFEVETPRNNRGAAPWAAKLRNSALHGAADLLRRSPLPSAITRTPPSRRGSGTSARSSAGSEGSPRAAGL